MREEDLQYLSNELDLLREALGYLQDNTRTAIILGFSGHAALFHTIPGQTRHVVSSPRVLLPQYSDALS